MMICSKCGTQPSAHDRFCRDCGTRLKSNRAATIFYRILALFAGVVGVVVFVIAIRSDQPSKYPIDSLACLSVDLRLVRDMDSVSMSSTSLPNFTSNLQQRKLVILEEDLRADGESRQA